MGCGRFTNDAELSTASVVAFDELTDAVGNSGHTKDFVLGSLCQFWQQFKVRLLWRESIETRMRPARVVPVKILRNVCSGRAHIVVRLEVHLLVLHATPDPFHEHVVPPGPASIHGQLAAVGQHNICELGGGADAQLPADLRHRQTRLPV